MSLTALGICCTVLLLRHPQIEPKIPAARVCGAFVSSTLGSLSLLCFVGMKIYDYFSLFIWIWATNKLVSVAMSNCLWWNSQLQLYLHYWQYFAFIAGLASFSITGLGLSFTFPFEVHEFQVCYHIYLDECSGYLIKEWQSLFSFLVVVIIYICEGALSAFSYYVDCRPCGTFHLDGIFASSRLHKSSHLLYS